MTGERVGSALPLALLLVGAVAIGAAATWPAPLHPDALVPATPFTDGHRIALGFADGRLGPRVLVNGAEFRPLLWPAELLAVALGPTVALNAVFALTPVFNALAGWLLGAALAIGGGGSAPPVPPRHGPWSRLVLGAALAWNPWVHATLANGQLEQAVIGGAALIWAVALGVRPTWVAAPLLGVTTFALGAAAPHVALAACAGLPVLGIGAVIASETRRPTALRWLVVVSCAALGAWLAGRYHAPSFDAVVRLFAPFGSVDAAPTGAQVKRAVMLVDLFRAPPLPPRLANGVVHSGYLGIPLIAAALGGLAWRRVEFVAALACLALAFGSGALPTPYGVLEALSPTIAASGTPYRFLIGVFVGLAASAAAIPWGPRGAIALAALLWADGWAGDPRPLPLATETVTWDPSSAALAAGTGPVLDLPVPGPRCKEGASHYLLEATRHGRPVPVVLRPGFEAWPEKDRTFARQVEAGLATCDPAVIAAIREAGFTAIVAHGHRNCNLEPAESACLRRALGKGRTEGKVEWWELP